MRVALRRLFHRRPAVDVVALQAELKQTRADLAAARAEIERLRPLALEGEQYRADLMALVSIYDAEAGGQLRHLENAMRKMAAVELRDLLKFAARKQIHL